MLHHGTAPAKQYKGILAWQLATGMPHNGSSHGFHEGFMTQCLLKEVEHGSLRVH